MGSGDVGIVKKLHNNYDAKVYGSMCSELAKILNRLDLLLPAIESARPGWTSGMLELCSLNNSLDKARLLLEHCAESSKLYLAITAEATFSRCQRIRNSLVQNLCQIQDMVPPPLASKIAEVLSYIRATKFEVDVQEEEASRALLNLLQQTNCSGNIEFEAFQIAASRLKLTSPKAILIEKRSLNKLLNKLNGSDTKKEKILNYFLYILKRYGKNDRQDSHEHKENSKEVIADSTLSTKSSKTKVSSYNDEHNDPSEGSMKIRQAVVPPVELCCPISSKLMYDPVVIASGQTYERSQIEKWFHEGHDTCPKTKKKLTSIFMVPNSCMKDLIANWCMKHGINVPEPCDGCNIADSSSWEPSHSYSISSLKNVSAALLDGYSGKHFLQNDYSNVSFISSDASYSSDSSHIISTEDVKDNQAHLFSWSVDYQQYQSFSHFNDEMFGRFFYELLELPIDVQGKEMENVKFFLENDAESDHLLSNGFAEALISILKNAHEMENIQALKSGVQLLLTALCKKRVEISSLTEDAWQLLLSFLDSVISTEVLMLLQELAQNPSCRAKIMAPDFVISIIKFLDSEDMKSLELSLKILHDLSADKVLDSYILSSRCLTKLACFLSDRKLAHLCLKIIQNITDDDEGAEMVAKDNDCLTSIVELLDTGSKEEQENAADILFSICSRSYANCLLVMDEGVIPALVEVSINGTVKGKEISSRLLHLLRDVRASDHFVNSYVNPEPTPEPIVNIVNDRASKQPISKSLGFLGRKLRFFSNSRSPTSFAAHGKD